MALSLGGSLNAQTVYLLERSFKTLALRIEQQNQNAGMIADWLNGLKEISKVYYPGLKDHPGHDIAKSQMSGFGGMLSFELDGGQSERFLKNLKVITPALSLGGVETIICSAATTPSIFPFNIISINTRSGFVSPAFAIASSPDAAANAMLYPRLLSLSCISMDTITHLQQPLFWFYRSSGMPIY